MTSRALVLFLLLAAGCSSPLGRVRVTVVFENDTRTQCIKASARSENGPAVNSNPAAIAREGRDTLLIGLGEAPDLLGPVSVTVSRFASADCSGTALSSQTKSVDIVHGTPTAMVEFRFSDGAVDGGVDAGVDAGSDGGVDAGCSTSACLNTPGECELAPATGCASDGGCRFSFHPAQTPCGDGGVCNTMGACISNVCAVLDAGAPCDDRLDCTPTSQCMSGICQGTCAQAPECNIVAQPLTCDSVTPTACTLRPTGDFSDCGPVGSQCLDGGCIPWLPFPPPINFVNTLATTPYPTAPWILASVDGGVCDTIIDTSGSTASVAQGNCGTPVVTSTVNDAGVMVITTLDLDVGPAARLQFIGTRPVQVVVIGNASIRGVVSVAPLLPGQQPAGTNPASCNAAQAGDANKKGGGGGGFGNNGGTGGEAGGAGGTASSTVSPLRGGCIGGAGFRSTGMSAGGTGGGAIELIVSGTITMQGGVVTASGAGGSGGELDNHGAGGGGSGGTVIIFATSINLTGGAVTSNGGGGGEGGDSAGGAGVAGALGPIQSISAAPAANGTGGGGIGGIGGDSSVPNGGNGGPGGGSGRGGGGGGGSVGVVYVRSHMSGNCTLGTGVISGHQPTSTNCI